MSIFSFLKLKSKDKEAKRSKKEHKGEKAKETQQTEDKSPKKVDTINESVDAEVADVTATQGTYANKHYSKIRLPPSYYGRYRSNLNRERNRCHFGDSLLYSELCMVALDTD